MNLFPIVAIIGATTTGKTSLAISIASKTNSAVLPMDQLQRYRYLEEGVGLDLEGLSVVTHYGYQILSPWVVSGPKDYVLWLKKAIIRFARKQPVIIEGGCTSYLYELISNQCSDTVFGKIKIIALEPPMDVVRNTENIKRIFSRQKIERIVQETEILEQLGFIKSSGLPFFWECERLFKHPEDEDDRLAWALRISARMYLPAYLALKAEITLENAHEWIIKNVQEIQEYQKRRVRQFLPAMNIRRSENHIEVEKEISEFIQEKWN